MSPPELKPEIWAHVISFLKRPLPPAKTKTDWCDLHQHDLCSAMRVNSVFYNKAKKLLYDTVVISDLNLFLFGVLSPPRLPPDQQDGCPINVKLGLMERIKRIHLVYLPFRSINYETILSTGSWDDVGEGWSESESCARMEMRKALSAIATLEQFELLYQILPNLYSISVGTYGTHPWDDVHLRLDKTSLELFDEARLVVCHLLHRCEPKFWCSHVSGGPFSTPTNSIMGYATTPALTITQHIDRMWKSKRGRPVVFGTAINRFCFSQQSHLYRGDIAYDLGWVWFEARLWQETYEVTRILEKADLPIKKAKLHVYNLFPPQFDRDMEIDREGTIRGTLSEWAPNDLTFNNLAATPVCEACGWSHEMWDGTYDVWFLD